MQLFACPISTNEKRAQHDTAYALLRYAVENVYQCPLPEIARSDRGKPYFPTAPEISFNLSHCDGFAVCSIGVSPLGVDVERIRPLRQGVLRRAFSTKEAAAVENSSCPDKAFFRRWTLKESYVKAIGIGISYPLHTVCFDLQGERILSSTPGWAYAQFLIADTWVISCCARESEALPRQIALWQSPRLGVGESVFEEDFCGDED